MSNKHLHFDKTIMAWDEGLPLGNGDLGCLIWNTPNQLRLSIDKAGIWDCSNPPSDQDNFNYANLQYLVKRRKQRKINKKYDDCYEQTTPTKLPTGKIILDLGSDQNVVSDLDLATAEAVLNIGGIELKSFIHANANYGMVTINRTNIGIKLENPQFGIKGMSKNKAAKGITQSLHNLCYDPAELSSFVEDGITYKYFIQPTTDCYYGIVVAVCEGSGSTLIAYTVGYGSDRSFVDSCIATVTSAIQTGYDMAVVAHTAWWQNYSALSSITLPDPQLEYQWYLNNYLLASCSRKGCYPMPLQGVWTADNGQLPPWKGDYHHDLNTQMSYTGYLKANRIDEGECFIDYLLDMAGVGKAFSKSFFGVDGLCLPSVMDISGNALGGWAQYALSPTNQLWLTYIMARHYHHTGNIDYLRDKIYPYMTAVGKFIMGVLTEVNGVYKLPLSSSPEVNDNKLSSWMTPNSNYDLALLRSFMGSMAEICEVMGDIDYKNLWKSRLTKLEPLAVNKDNVLMLSPDFSLKESHRHLSHCMSIYPLRDMTYTGTNRGVIDATIANLHSLGIKYWVGYTFGWVANLHIVQGNGDKAASILKDFFSNYCTDNGFHVNGDHRRVTDCGFKYRHFTLEGNFLALDGINNMLLYSEKDGVRLFPAVPSAWDDISFTDLRGYGGILISATRRKGVLSHVKITATHDTTITLLGDDLIALFGGSTLHLTAGNSQVVNQ